MPERWFVPIRGLDPSRVRLEHVHAAVSAWFDRSPAEHKATDKPYSISPATRDETGCPGVQICTLTTFGRQRLLDAVAGGVTIRLGNQIRATGKPRLLRSETWGQLADGPVADSWVLEFLTPTTFRSGDRASPLPRVETILDGLARTWRLWSDVASEATQADWPAVWVSDLELASEVVELRLRGRDGVVRPIVISGVVGRLTLRCEDDATAGRVAPLLRMAPYCGVGSMTAKGLGVTEVVARAAARVRRHLSSLDGGHVVEGRAVVVEGHGPSR